MEAPVPYNLKPKKTKLAEGPDESLDPVDSPTDPEKRSTAPFAWPAVSTTKGPAGPPEAPLAPPGTDPAIRGVRPLLWPSGAGIPNRPMAETISPIGDLDPDIALWREIVVNIWPFGGPPTTGTWPKGWLGVDNTGQPWACIVGGSPGTWSAVGFTSAGVASFNTRTGAVVLEASDIEATFANDNEIFIGTGNGSGTLLNMGSARVFLVSGGTNIFPAGTPTAVPFNGTGAGSYNIGTATVIGSSIVIGGNGLYDIAAQVYFVNNNSITRYVASVMQNSSIGLESEGPSNGSFAPVLLTGQLELNAADVITVQATVTGATGSAAIGSGLTYLSVSQVASTTS